ncbi:hypothetical protein COCC4DRAFT_73977 [Bipolaris maydis ATCC 48331]|uniref:Uncharacterized protein n=2 Tax=Cochliobolus heterostrophus TaxID=5016 RepID=M2TJX5_COCH5|nr:uncharacterized protein COCC4DRAFT_73977 [Bipolaris maydis ATCC 48331]EMD97760.1 hypothetical protein COCHEDRAFT_1221072 [Bipolaris maydis C5]ENI02845.1 hypothetical protein COCC4DRAFT_73977 [Bipolaris maydis ATCC 48331]KAJ6210893.1 hypothetical protein PSV09DRAFT_1221072 [Bipolaris maydis]
MSMSTNDPNAGSAIRLYQTERIPRNTGRICCACNMLFARASVPALCLNCGHGTCEACPVIEFVSHGHNLSSYESTNKGPRNLLRRIQPALWEPDQAQNLDGHNGQKLRRQVQYERDHEQGNQVEPHREHLEEQQSSSISGRKKRKLNMTKCQRCRDDKKACIRQGSEKCNRCTEKELHCSEGTRVIRPRKLASRSLPPTQNVIPSPVDSDVSKISFDQIALLVSYYQMMVKAKEKLIKLGKHIRSLFGTPLSPTYDIWDPDFISFVVNIYDEVILTCLTKLLTEKQFSKTLPTRSSLISLILAVDVCCIDHICPICQDSDIEVDIELPMYGLNDSMDLFRNFVVKEHLILRHGLELNKDKLEEEIQIYTTLSTKVPREISVALESLGLSELAEQSRAIGLYYPDTTIPLHHAAAMGSIGICKVLVGRGGEFDMGAEDFNQRTALDYAVIRKHQEVVDLLTDCYLEAGLNEKVAKAHRIAAAVRDGTYESWKTYDY